MPTEGIAEGLVQEVLYSHDPARIYGTVSELLYSYEPAQVDNAVGEVLWAFDPPNIHNVLFEVITSSTLFAVGGPDQSVASSVQVTLNGSLSVNAVSYLWELTAVPGGSGLATGSLGTTASVNFTPDVEGTYSTKLTVTSAGAETAVDLVTVSAVAPAVANAGSDSTVAVSTQATLDGTGSTGTITSYLWELTTVPGGSSFSVSSTIGTTASVNFTPDVAGTFVARLTATGPLGSSTDTADVVGAVTAVSGAGSNLLAQPTVQTTLNGTGSSGTITTYLWELTVAPGGSSFSTPSTIGTSASINFTPDVVGTFTARLTVTGPLNSATDTTDIVSAIPVVSNAGPNKTTQVSTSVGLVGAGSTGTITSYAWTLTAVPGGSSFSPGASLGTTVNVPFVPDVVGTFTARLTVVGAHGESTDTMNVGSQAATGGPRRQRRRKAGRDRGRGFFTVNQNSSLASGFDSSFS